MTFTAYDTNIIIKPLSQSYDHEIQNLHLGQKALDPQKYCLLLSYRMLAIKNVFKIYKNRLRESRDTRARQK